MSLGRSSSSRMLILIVEDEAVLALDYTAELEDGGHRVLGPAHGVRDAILLLASEKPDLALVDLNLKADGPQAGFGLSKYLISRDVPVVFVTGGQLPEYPPTGVIGCLRKPFPTGVLTDTVDAATEILDGRAPLTCPAQLQCFGPWVRRS